MSMFKRANASYESKSTKADLAKQLLASSSPPPQHNGNIKDQFQKRSGSSYAKLSQSSEPPAPLQSRPSNTYHPPKPSQSKKPFASLYQSEDSFREEPDLINLADDTQSAKRRKAMASVDLFEDDFSDDADLDLDFECPSALPVLGMESAKVQATPTRTAVEAFFPENSSVLSWSQSSPSHLQPKSQSTSQSSTKRSAPESDLPPQPAVKKRTLPIPYEKYKKTESSTLDKKATPAAKPKADKKGPFTWDLTPGAVKAQQKELKGKAKKASAVPGAEVGTEEVKHAVKSHTVKQSAISLSKEQEVVKDLVCGKGKSVFFTGPAGTGKSVLMRAIIAQLKKQHVKDPDRLAVTASTGLAACNIGGMTLHSFSGIGLGKDDVATLVKKIRRNPKAKNRWLRTKILVVDEISMVDGDLFDKLSQIGRTLRNNGRPWGGIQLIITGDFFQLPPVPDYNSRDTKFAFEAATWSTSIDHTIGLTEVFRQKDPVFAQMLNEMRLGHIGDETVKAFRGMARPLNAEGGIEVTELFPTRNEVEQSNQRRLRELPGEPYRYEAMDSGSADPPIREKLLSNMMAPKVLELKKGAQVMLIKNLDDSLVNGSLGTVLGFSTEAAFEISGGFPDDDDRKDSEVDPNVVKRLAAFGRELDKAAGPDKRKWPLVQFHAVDGTSRIMLCVSEPWKVETPTGEIQASREQLPLILAWALSIHKAQGQTLARVKVNLGKVFEKGQAYVALSRAVTQEGLQVLNFDKKKVMAHPRVVTFYQKLYSAESAATPGPNKNLELHEARVSEKPAPKKMGNASITGFATSTVSRPPAKTFGGMINVDDEEEAMAHYA